MARIHRGMKVTGDKLPKQEQEERRKKLSGKRYVGRPWQKRDYEVLEAVRLAAGDIVKSLMSLAKAVTHARGRGMREDDVFAAVGKAVLASLEARAMSKMPPEKWETKGLPHMRGKGYPWELISVKRGGQTVRFTKCLGRTRKVCPKCKMLGLNRWPGPEKGTHLLCSRCGWTDLKKSEMEGRTVTYPRKWYVRTNVAVPGRRKS